MTLTTRACTVAPVATDSFDETHARADRWLLVGSVLAGTFLLAPVGAPMLAYGLVLLRRAQRAGAAIRPWAVTIFGLMLLIDTTSNCLGWGMDLLPSHDTAIVQTFYSGIGRLIDAGYYIHYNTLPIGGTAAAGEKALEIGGVLFLFPLRLAATWGFMKMKRWGYHYLVTTTWMYILIWWIYAANLAANFPDRIGATMFGMVGYWALNIPYFGAFIMMPYLYTADSRAWWRA